MANVTDSDRAKFAGLVAKAWGDAELAKRYRTDPQKVLAEHGIKLPQGVPTPVIPPHPQGGVESGAWQHLKFEQWDLKIEKLPGGTTTGISVSSLACAACPVSCFSSVSN